MRKVSCLYILVLILALWSSGTAWAQERFFESLYDIPVMAGLSEIEDMAMSFDHPDGRIAQAGARTGSLSEDAVLAFYAKVLPQMGWQAEGNGIYSRKGEKLQIFPEKSAGSLIMRFSLEPR